MALRMFREGDFVHLLRNGRDYLDKPHLLFWSAMAGYRALGVHDFSYRLPSVLVSLLGAFSCGRLARRLYGPRAGQLAPLLFITAQSILLGDHDVRMDALLTGFTAFALWQLVRFVETEELGSLVLGSVGLGLAVSSKGMVAAALTGLCLVLFLWGRGRLALLRSPRGAVGPRGVRAHAPPGTVLLLPAVRPAPGEGRRRPDGGLGVEVHPPGPERRPIRGRPGGVGGAGLFLLLPHPAVGLLALERAAPRRLVGAVPGAVERGDEGLPRGGGALVPGAVPLRRAAQLLQVQAPALPQHRLSAHGGPFGRSPRPGSSKQGGRGRRGCSPACRTWWWHCSSPSRCS